MNKLILATYNIQFSQHPQEITQNILLMRDLGVNIFCLQEIVYTNKAFIVDVLLKALGSEWKATYNLGEEKSLLSMGTGIIWNSKVLQLEKAQNESLPRSTSLAIHEKAFSWLAGGTTIPFQRRVTIGYFKFNQQTVRVTTVHLDHNGGPNNRQKQLEYLVKFLSKDKTVQRELICGDFNSFDLLKNGKEKQMHKHVLKDFTDVSAKSGWTGDLNDIDVINGSILSKLIKVLNIHIRRKLDYIYVRNLKSLGCKKLLLNGSDHNPLIVYLDL